MTLDDPGKGLFFDKEGRPLEALEWGRLFEDIGYRFIKTTDLAGERRVVTIWQGFCGRGDLDCDPPHLFATALLPTVDVELWAETEEAALEQHDELVRTYGP